MSFIKYQKEKSKKGISSKTIGINRKGRFAFYKPVVEKHLQNIDYVELYFDPETKKVGILPLDEPTADCFKIQGRTTKMIVAKKFLNRFQIAVEDRRYDFAAENGMLIVQL
ncbi:MAG TPA: hypothetical protein DDW65_22735 [Firmicutes bacterium]|nr:hypothetical protein [Bacillota bacterium]